MSHAGSGRRECRGAVPARLSARGGSRERRAGSQSRGTGTHSTNHATVSTNYSRRRSIIQKPSRSTPPAAALASIGACSGADHRMGTHARTHVPSRTSVGSYAMWHVVCCQLYTLAAEQDHLMAAFNLGRCYVQGRLPPTRPSTTRVDYSQGFVPFHPWATHDIGSMPPARLVADRPHVCCMVTIDAPSILQGLAWLSTPKPLGIGTPELGPGRRGIK